jgi:hypothetical protein
LTQTERQDTVGGSLQRIDDFHSFSGQGKLLSKFVAANVAANMLVNCHTTLVSFFRSCFSWIFLTNNVVNAVYACLYWWFVLGYKVYMHSSGIYRLMLISTTINQNNNSCFFVHAYLCSYLYGVSRLYILALPPLK